MEIVRCRMDGLDLPPQAREEVIAELASHMEDQYENALLQGSTVEQAENRACGQISDWQRLRRRVQRAKEDPVNNRVKQILIPGMVTLGVSGLAWQALYLARESLYAMGIPSPVYGLHGSTGVVVNYPWLVLLPFLGAFAACWSRRMGGTVRSQVLAASFPALIYAGIFVFFGLLLAPFVDRHVPVGVKLVVTGIFLLGWGIIPGAALTLGALPFLRRPAEEPRTLSQSAGS